MSRAIPKACRVLLLLLSLPGAQAVTGCASPSYDSADELYYRNEPDRMAEAYEEARKDEGRNALLGVEKLLSAALLRGDWREAEGLALRASLLVNIFVAGEPGERDALSLLGQEKDKPFKGEPHERVMVDYYLGIIRFRKGDYEGALAAFRSATQKDRGTFLLPVEESEARRRSDNAHRYIYSDDYALLKFLAAKCYQLLGEPEDAEKLLGEARALRPDMPWLFEEGMDPRNNIIVIIEGGRAPVKVRAGRRGAILAYDPGPGVTVEDVAIDGERLSRGMCEDLHAQATTLGGRGVDELNLVKARRQEALEAAGFATFYAGTILSMAGSNSRHREVQAAGLLAAFVGLGLMIFSGVAIDPAADIRSWSTLPGQIFLAVGQAPPGRRIQLRIRARAEGGGDLTQEWTEVPVEDGPNLHWIRLLPGRTGGRWPGKALEEIPVGPPSP